MSRLRWLADALNPFQPIRGDFRRAVALTLLSATVLGSNVAGHWLPGIIIGVAESLLCPFGPLAYGLYRRVRG